MAAPVPGFVQLADDAANLGDKVRTQSRLVGANAVVEHFFVPVSLRSKRVFHYTTQFAVQAAAQDATATGFFWLQVPAASAWDAVVRKLSLSFGTANTLTNTEPRVVLARFTFTGTPSGATLTPARRKSGEAPNTDVRTAVTGMTVTLGAGIASFMVPQMHAAGQFFGPPLQSWPVDSSPFEDDDIVLAPGEGALLYQPDAGTAADPRDFTINLMVEEVER